MNNNPFEPVTTDPSIDPPQTDNAADDFTAGDSVDNVDTGINNFDGAAKAPLSIDGISPNYDNIEKIDNVTLIGSKPDDNPSSTAGAILTDDHAGDFLGDFNVDDAPQPENPTESAQDLPALTPAPATPGKKEKKAKVKKEKPVKEPKDPSTKHVTISLLTIIFFVLAIAGIAGTIWFYLQNSKNADALADETAKVQQLEDELANNSTSENTVAGQYDGLNDKIEDLSGQNEESLKTVEEYKKQVDDLTKKNTDLTTQLAEQTKKAADISTLTTRVDTMLKKFEDLE